MIVIISLITGCSGITPYEPRNHREEGPTGGLLTGPDGQWTIGVGGGQSPSVENR